MEFYTSYFAMLKKLPKDIVPISICGKAPVSYTGIQYKKLAPKYDSFIKYKQDHDMDYYTECYKTQVLSRLIRYDAINDLLTLSNGKSFALICYEKPDDFCHRHLVAEWLNGYGCKCEEYNFS